MPLSPGTKLGPYEILSPIGAGGMGEVYRARDPRLGRDVAVKIISAGLVDDATRVRRFEQEARAAATLDHPNILAVHDLGRQNGAPYIVSELLEGETLRERLRLGPLPVGKAVDYALQISRGLAVAHDHGVVHRDIKPENIFITTEGRVKILDFGLAKLTQTDACGDDSTRTMQSDPNMVVGTIGYMSPEQVRGKAADLRTDLFALGAILYEMLSGKRAFHGDSAADTMSAILTKDPPELTEVKGQLSPVVDQIVRHCLEKSPAERFQSAHDLAFNLQLLTSTSGRATKQAMGVGRHRPSRGVAALLTLTMLAVLGAVFLLGRTSVSTPPMAAYKPLTFRRGTVWNARYSADGRLVVYSAAWDGNRPELFSVRSDVPASVPLGITNADVVSISRGGEMALILNRHFGPGANWVNTATQALPLSLGTLARAPLNGGSPRPILTDVLDADWSHDGSELVVTHLVGDRFRLEYPINKVLYEEPGQGYLSYPRFSPKGDKIAFLEHPVLGDDLGSVAVIDLAGNRRVLSTGWSSIRGLAWSPSGDEVWFTAADSGYADAVHAVSMSGRQRILARLLPDLVLQDVTTDGHVLLVHSSLRGHIFARGPGSQKEQELRFLELSAPVDLSADGESLLVGGFSSVPYGVFLRKTDGSPPVRLGDGGADALSSDGIWALGHTVASPSQLMLLPIGAGAPRQITQDNLDHHDARFLGADRIVFSGSAEGHRRTFVQRLNGAANPQPVGPEGLESPVPSNDSRYLAARVARHIVVCPLADCSQPRTVPELGDADDVLTWAADNRHILVAHLAIPCNVFSVDPSSGQKEIVKQLTPADNVGIQGVRALITPDGRYYAYGVTQVLSGLYEVDRLR